MKIRKTFQAAVPSGKVLNSYTESNVDTYSCNYINGLETYSTDETKTNKVWIDGKPIYRKVITGNVSNGSIAHGLTNVDFVNAYGYFIAGSGNFMPLPSLRVTYNNYSAGFYVNATNVMFDKGADVTGTAYITLEYIKTTD